MTRPKHHIMVTENVRGHWFLHLTRQERPRARSRAVAHGSGDTLQAALRLLADRLDADERLRREICRKLGVDQ